jgi:hypothetical protein
MQHRKRKGAEKGERRDSTHKKSKRKVLMEEAEKKSVKE